MVRHVSQVTNDSLTHLNGDVLCAIDTETTGLEAGHNDIIEVAVVPIDSQLDPMKDIVPFVCLIQPKDRYPDSWTEEAYKVHGISREHLMKHGVGPWRAADTFEEWFKRLNIAPEKKIVPLGFNYPFDKNFIFDWLGPKTHQLLFGHRYRDVMPVVNYLNDLAAMELRPAPFPQQGLQNIRKYLGVESTVTHRALDDAMTTIKCYKKLMSAQKYFL